MTDETSTANYYSVFVVLNLTKKRGVVGIFAFFQQKLFSN
jgi:hypothetical protein